MTAPQLFEPVPTRRLIVPHGSEAHWGIDVSVRAVSVGAVHAGAQKPLERAVVTFAWPKLAEGARLAAAHREITLEARSAVQFLKLPRPGFIFVEQPSGQTPNLQLAYMVGTVIAAVAGEFPHATVETVPPQSWKKRACGNGAIRKRDPQTGKPWSNREDYGVLKWARSVGYRGISWDEADAMAVAEAARLTVALDPR